ncbi:uncharacterized protein BDR25DRAFT_324552 [Lindgomyces ingoldianus]|uniref:Uncharacterized protein n=1 Tax=Lindgomyces ingoldianus TaxID=673940 RepID=A0ACB6QZM5_9PLEO|nr:uncharacterized protein BDR25DRAFT_324552 [Lindgomyces ingoldianus]KAF2472028.1 hypothetical protein BDR25DRAFT_324552 [Lindgomyces ingoldianus]
MADQSTQQRQQSASYPSPHSYPSPSMQPTYTYPPPQGQSNPEPYRGSPQGQNMSLPSLNLPPIRLQDGQTQPPPQHSGQQPMGSPLPPPQHGMPQYYQHPGHAPPPGQQMNMAGGPHQLAMRYQLPPQGEQRILSGGRHKKEIKRRTKTGCLTCRKRRIKCDEAHPICRNCQKSKRECLGYDPIFKQQPGPAQIQPAPNSAPHPTSVPASSPPTTVSYGGQVPQGYAPAATAGYAPPVPTSASGHPPYENFNNSAIDPALAAQDPAMHGGQPPYNGTHAMNPALRGVGSSSPYSSVASDTHPMKAKRIKITDIFPIGNHNPPEIPPRTSPIPPELDDEFAKILANDYCLGLDAILETKWYSTNNNALNKILADRSLHEEAVAFAETVKYQHNSFDMARIFSQEARLIWHMLGVCKQNPPATNGTNGTAPANAENEDRSLKEVRARFDILESLLTNQNLETNPLRQISYPADVDIQKKAEIDFWEQLGNFVVYADSDSAPAGAVEQALSTMRQVLQQIEARDVIYSIAIARSSGGRVRGFPNSLPVPVDQNPESDPNKLNVAMGFISHECRNSTQQVIARICDMATLSWTVSRAP